MNPRAQSTTTTAIAISLSCIALTTTTTPGKSMTDLVALKAANARRWANARLTRVFSPVAKHLVAPEAKARYQAVSAKTGVPWAFIAVAHERESSQNWNGSLAQGDPWNRVSVHVPAGRGPFRSWEDAAIDALVNCAPFAARNRDWSIGGTLTMLEQYNGLGQASGPSGWAGRPYTPERKQRFAPQPSAYIWAGTDQYIAGKYVADHVYDSTVVDTQLGCAGLLIAMIALDPTITFTGVVLTPQPVPAKPPVSKTAKGAGGAVVAGTVAVGVQQGWGPAQWILAAFIAVGLGAAFYFIRKNINS
jgi:lysozyme family protein